MSFLSLIKHFSIESTVSTPAILRHAFDDEHDRVQARARLVHLIGLLV